MADWPPISEKNLASLKRELGLIPSRHREDAFQEAWVAYLEGKDPIAGAKRYAKAEFDHEQRELPESQIGHQPPHH